MKLPQYRLLKIDLVGTMNLEAKWVDFVTCGECKGASNQEDGRLFCKFFGLYVSEDDYCSGGMRI